MHVRSPSRRAGGGEADTAGAASARLPSAGLSLLRLARLALAVLTCVAIGVQYAHTASGPRLSPVNFFSFFTIDSNIIAVAVFIWGALRPRGTRPGAAGELVRGAATLYLTVTGVVFALLLADLPAELQGTLPWVNTVVHQVMPLAVVADWLLDPPAGRIRLGQALWWLVFPAAYLAYSLARGPGAHFYPYPFLDPRAIGYGGVVLHCVGILVAMAALLWCVVAVGNARGAGRRERASRR